MEEKSSDSVQSVEIPSDMYNLLQNGGISMPEEYDSPELMQLTVSQGLQDQETKQHLKILEQPRQRGFRFRYGCEGPSHGGLPGSNSQRGKKSFPSVEICNYKGSARIVVSLVTNEDTPRPHAHSLVGKHCRDGLCTVQVGPKDMTASFPNLGILHVTRKDVVPTLKRRILDQHRLYNSLMRDGQGMPASVVDPSDAEVEKKAREMAKDMDLSVVRLCFQTYLPDSNGHFTQPLDPVISVPVFDSKAPNATTLKICRMDKSAGCCTGGEEVYLLCDKVQKEDIQVRFFELSTDGQITWQEFAEFGPTDVHRQYAIVFKTPAYRDTNIDRPVYVHVQLKRKSDNETSDPKPFTYHPQVPDREGILRKRKKHLAHFNEYSSSYQGSMGGGSGSIGGGGGSGGGYNFTSNMGFSQGFNNQMSTAVRNQAITQQAPQQMHTQPNAVARSNTGLQTVFTKTTSNSQPLPSISTLTTKQRAQQQQFQLQQNQQQLQQHQQQQPPQMQVDMSFQIPTFQSGASIRMPESQIKVEGENNNTQYCNLETVPFQLSTDVQRDCGSEPINISDLIPKGVGVQRSKDTEEKTIQTDDIPIDINSMAWRVAEVTANALHDYAATGDVKNILTVQRHLIAVEDDNGDTPLHAAVIHKKYDVLHALLSAVIKIPNQGIVNQVNHLKQTPLHLAVLTKQSRMVEVLLRCGATPNVSDQEGNTPVHLAAKHGVDDGMTFLVCGPKAKAAIIPPKADLNLRNYAGLAPVHLAVLSRNLHILRTLVSAGADASLPDGKIGRSPLHYAIEMEDYPILGYLLIEAEADVQAATFEGNTPLHIASSLDLRAIAALLIAAGADPKQENGDVESASDAESDSEDDGIREEEEEEETKESSEIERRGKTPYQLARSDKMKEILRGRSTVLSQSLRSREIESFEMESTASSIRLCSDEDVGKDQKYFPSTKSARKGVLAVHPKGYSALGSSLVTAKGNIDQLPESTVDELSALLDKEYPVTLSWFTLANRLGLDNMLRFLKHVPNPTRVILSQYQAIDGTVEELRAVLVSMEHHSAVAVLDKSLSWQLQDKEDTTLISVNQSLKELNLAHERQCQEQAVY
ncbi:nuclear factor NF-kappa-B p105 subunit-like [Diadema antillarum]|uniref:nuclear factor NF-kappa-B p105 subunit-like n=1 Tax=Diadema antillarum TaxID=105358 RepID=UPI003A8598AA